MKKRKTLRFLIAVVVFSLLFSLGALASAANKVLELRNSTSRTIWVAKSASRESNLNNLYWTSLTSGKWGAWNVTEYGYLYFAYAKTSDPGQREKAQYVQLPTHKHYRWFWMVVTGGNPLKLVADYERAKGRSPWQ
jgi:hypothetical protein